MQLADIGIGLAGSGAIAAAAYAKRSLSVSGAAAAVAVGTLLYALGSAVWFGTLIAFFVSSTLLSKWKREKRRAAESGYEKSGTRDAGQVLANGGVGALLCAANAWAPHPAWLAAYLGVTAAVTADTWATELGGLSRTAPRSILTGRPVPAGASGGVTPLGLAASAGGGLFIGAVAYALLRLAPGGAEAAAFAGAAGAGLPAACAAVALAGGLAGSLGDSLAGAAWQRMYRCRVCGREVERRVHCGEPAAFSRGVRWMGNDAVNILASLAGGVTALAVWLLLY